MNVFAGKCLSQWDTGWDRVGGNVRPCANAPHLNCADRSLSHWDTWVRLGIVGACVSDEFADVTPTEFTTRQSSPKQTTQPARDSQPVCPVFKLPNFYKKAPSQIPGRTPEIHDGLKRMLATFPSLFAHTMQERHGACVRKRARGRGHAGEHAARGGRV